MKRRTSSYSTKDKAESSQTVNNFTTFNQFVQSSIRIHNGLKSLILIL